MPSPLFDRLDHIAIVVRSTDEALTFYRDTLGLEVVIDEEIESGQVRLTHLDMGNVQLQLVQPLTSDHPLQAHLDQHGEGLHHLCFQTDDVQATLKGLPQRHLKAKSEVPHDGPLGRKAGFIATDTTRGVLWEMTGRQPAGIGQ
ncbi:MAG: VOC family protein [Planctomycetota bacterium]